MSYPTVEQMLYELPPCIDDSNGRNFLHLQPWNDRSGWNAFYGAVNEDGWAVHPILRADGVNPADALVNLYNTLNLTKFTLEADPNGEVEETAGESKTLGKKTSD